MRVRWLLIVPAIASTYDMTHDFKNPIEIMNMLRNSKVKYQVKERPDANYSFSQIPQTAGSPSLEWHQKINGEEIKVKNFSPNERARLAADSGFQALRERQLEKALQYYHSSYHSDTGYSKALTYIGNVYYFLKESDSAEFYLKQSISKNPVDYQAHYVLAQLYLQRNSYLQAKEEVTYTLMLNRSDPKIQKQARLVLANFHEKLLDAPFTLGFSIQKDTLGVLIAISNMYYMPAASCFAAWENEPEFASVQQHDNLPHYLQITNCLANQTFMALDKIVIGDSIDAQTKRLVEIYNDSLFPTMVRWEIMSRSSSRAIYSLPDSEMQKIRAYIRKYLIAPTLP